MTNKVSTKNFELWTPRSSEICYTYAKNPPIRESSGYVAIFMPRGKSRRLCTDKAVKYTRNAGTCANFRESRRQTAPSAGTQTNVAAGNVGLPRHLRRIGVRADCSLLLQIFQNFPRQPREKKEKFIKEKRLIFFLPLFLFPLLLAFLLSRRRKLCTVRGRARSWIS